MLDIKVDNIELINIDGSELKIIKLTNLEINSESYPKTIIYGKSFMGAYHQHFHHFIIDCPGQYEYLKSKIGNDLKIIFDTPSFIAVPSSDVACKL